MEHLKCPFCESENFAELRLSDYSVDVTDEGEIEERDFEESYAYSFLFTN